MPAARATRQACWPAAPPKQNSVNSAASSPRRVDTSRMALAIDSTPTSRKDSATVSAEQPPATWVAARAASVANSCATTAVSMRERPSRPKSAGSVSARKRPSSTCTSVRVSGPPRP